jgi:hypothetical protein
MYKRDIMFSFCHTGLGILTFVGGSKKFRTSAAKGSEVSTAFMVRVSQI